MLQVIWAIRSNKKSVFTRTYTVSDQNIIFTTRPLKSKPALLHVSSDSPQTWHTDQLLAPAFTSRYSCSWNIKPRSSFNSTCFRSEGVSRIFKDSFKTLLIFSSKIISLKINFLFVAVSSARTSIFQNFFCIFCVKRSSESQFAVLTEGKLNFWWWLKLNWRPVQVIAFLSLLIGHHVFRVISPPAGLTCPWPTNKGGQTLF